MRGPNIFGALIPALSRVEAKAMYRFGDRLSAGLSVLRFDNPLTASGRARLGILVTNDGSEVWSHLTLVLCWSVLDEDGADLILSSQKVLELVSLKPGKKRVLTTEMSVPVNSVTDVCVTLHLQDSTGAYWEAEDSPVRLHRHVSGQSARDVPAEFDYEVMYRTVNLEEDWWTPVGPASRAEYEGLGRGKCAQLVSLGLHSESRVLDIGCGTGQLTEALAPILSARGLYYGTDLAKPAVDYCRAKFPLSNFHFVKNEQTTIPISGVEFDFVFLGSVLTHMFPRDIDLMLGEIRRLLANAGSVVADAFVSRMPADFVGNRSMIQLNEGNLLEAFRKHGFGAKELYSTKWNEACRRVIYRLTASEAQ